MMTAPDFARDPRPLERRRRSTNGPPTAAETVLIAHLARACDLLDQRLARAHAPEEKTA